MADRTLTAPEIDNLLSIFRGGYHATRQELEVENFDVNQPSRVPRGAFGALKIRHQEAAGMMAQDLKALLESNVLVTLDCFDQVVFDPWRLSLPDPCCAFIVEMTPLSEPGVLLVEHELAFAVVDRLLGGTGRTEVGVRDLTPTEVGVLEEFLEPIVNAHVLAWQPYTKLRGQVARSIFVPRFIRDIPDKEVVLTAGYRLEWLGMKAALQFALPVTGLEPHLQHEPRRNLGDADRSELRKQMVDQLAQVEVNLSIKLGETELLLSELVGLERGDIVMLDNGIRRALELLVEGEPQLVGHLKSRGRRLVFETLAAARSAMTPPAAEGGSS